MSKHNQSGRSWNPLSWCRRLVAPSVRGQRPRKSRSKIRLELEGLEERVLLSGPETLPIPGLAAWKANMTTYGIPDAQWWIAHSEVVQGASVTNGGSGYTTAPTVTITGGDGSGAAGVAVLGTGAKAGQVVSINITNGGSGYITQAPTVTITGGGGSGATATSSIWVDQNETGMYDPVQVMYEMYQYTGNSTFLAGYQAALKQYRDVFLPHVGYSPQTYNGVFPLGLASDYQANGTATDLTALNYMASSMGIAVADKDPEFYTNYDLEREWSWQTLALVVDNEQGGTWTDRATIKNMEQGQLNILADITSGNDTDGYQPFMVGIASENLIHYYNESWADPTIKSEIFPAIKAVADYMWSNQWDVTNGGGSFLLNSPANPSDAGATDGLIAPLYGWLFHETGSKVYRNEGDQIFDSGPNLAPGNAYLPVASKEIDEEYLWTFDYVNWRTEAPVDQYTVTQDVNAPVPVSLFGTDPTPSISTSTTSSQVGVKFNADEDGVIDGLRFYKGSGNTGTHTANVWNAAGQLMTSATFADEDASGWQVVYFSEPVRIQAGVTYTVSYTDPNGDYADTPSYFTSAQTHDHLYTATDAGVYGTSQTAAPTTAVADNYWVDVIFTPMSREVPSEPASSMWNQAATPGSPAVPGSSGEYGVQFSTDVDGLLTGMMIYSGGNYRLHSAALWDANGNLIAGGNTSGGNRVEFGFTDESGSGWQWMTFSNPVPLKAGQLYTVSYYAYATNPATTANYFTSALSFGHIHTAVNAGVYIPYSGGNLEDESVYPTTHTSTNYWVDVLFQPLSQSVPTTPTNTLWSTSVTPGQTVASSTQSVERGMSFQSSVAGVVTGMRIYVAASGTYTADLWDRYGYLLDNTTNNTNGPNPVGVSFTASAAGWQTVTLPHPVYLQANTPYFASYNSPNGSYAYDDFSGPRVSGPLEFNYGSQFNVDCCYSKANAPFLATGENYYVDVEFAPLTGGTASTGQDLYTLWGPGTIPSTSPTPGAQVVGISSSTTATEVGVKFQADVSGSVYGLRVYVGQITAGTYVGHLWNAQGTSLASITFSPSTDGWATIYFSNPVSITANTTYTASYLAPGGLYADAPGYFANPLDRSPLHVAINGGVSHSGGDAFPTTAVADNYWVDVLFAPTPGQLANGQTPPSSLWSTTSTPDSIITSNPVAANFDLGVQFSSDVNGYITALRVYVATPGSGYVAELWDPANQSQPLASAAFSPSAAGWTTVNFSNPVAIKADYTYVASYYDPTNNFARSTGYFGSAISLPWAQVNSGYLHAWTSVWQSGNRYPYDTSMAGPAPHNASSTDNFWVDVQFNQMVPSLVTAVTSTGTVLNNSTNWIGAKITVGSSNLTVTGLGRYILSGNNQSHPLEIVTTSGTVVASATLSAAEVAATPASTFAYVALSSSVVLTAGQSYYLVSSETSGGDSWHDVLYGSGTKVTTTSAATINSGVYKNGTGWTTVGGTGNEYGPLDLEYAIAQVVSGSAAPTDSASSDLTAADLAPVVSQAIQAWAGTGLTADQVALLRGVRFEITNLPSGIAGETLGLGADADQVVYLDRQASGYGWSLGATVAPGRVDLLTVVAHELGHILGLPDVTVDTRTGGLMDTSLPLGERRLPLGLADSGPGDSLSAVSAPAVGTSPAATALAGEEDGNRVATAIEGVSSHDVALTAVPTGASAMGMTLQVSLSPIEPGVTPVSSLPFKGASSKPNVPQPFQVLGIEQDHAGAMPAIRGIGADSEERDDLDQAGLPSGDRILNEWVNRADRPASVLGSVLARSLPEGPLKLPKPSAVAEVPGEPVRPFAVPGLVPELSAEGIAGYFAEAGAALDRSLIEDEPMTAAVLAFASAGLLAGSWRSERADEERKPLFAL